MVEGSYTLEVRGWEEYSANLDRVKDVFSQAMDDIANDVVRRIQEEAPSDTGQLMSNEMWVVEKTDDFTRTIRSAKEYALMCKKGRDRHTNRTPTNSISRHRMPWRYGLPAMGLIIPTSLPGIFTDTGHSRTPMPPGP